jgi:hypothetical protein
MSDKYCIRHREGTNAWVLKEWVPARHWFDWSRGYKVIKTFGTEARALAHMRAIAEPRVEWKYYNEHGYEEVGDWCA